MADEAHVVEAGSAGQSPLVAVTFQRDIHRKEKYLEAEPKALGITQIGLSVFQINCVSVFLAKGLNGMDADIFFLISSLLVVIAGSVAIAARNLHLSTLRGCLGMQIVACGASIFNIIVALTKMDDLPSFCWHYYYYENNSSSHSSEFCHHIQGAQSHFYAEGVVIQAVLLAISATLAAYCCKVINCCSPSPKMPVITIQTPPVQQ